MTGKPSFVLGDVEFVDEYYQVPVLREFLNRPTEEPKNCAALGGIDHDMTIRYPVDVCGETQRIEAVVGFVECYQCGALPLSGWTCIYSCDICGEDEDHDTDGWEVIESAIKDNPTSTKPMLSRFLSYLSRLFGR